MQSFIARQPIFDKDENVEAYEILYRSGSENKFDGIDGDKASRQVLFNTFQTFGIDNLTKGKPVFINFTENLICDEFATLFPNKLLVVEILEDIIPRNTLIEKTKSLKNMGYRIALDDFIYKPGLEEFLELADIIKVDFLISEKEAIEFLARYGSDKGIVLLAEKVESRQEYDYAKSLGFTLFQGYFFSKPEIVVSKNIEPIKATYLQLLSEVNKKEINFTEVSAIIGRDLGLTYNLLKLVNSSAFGFRYKINTVKHGVVALGQAQLKKWVYLLLVNIMGEDEPDELTKLSLIRARFLELVAIKAGRQRNSQELFLVGLLSLLDVILKRPKEEILDELKATEEVRAALIEQEGKFGKMYKMILAYEMGNWDQFIACADELGISTEHVSKSYMEAILWYDKLQIIK